MTNAQRKFLRSLQQKKERKATNSFLIEGAKIVTETLQATHSPYKIKQLFVTQDFLTELENQNILNSKVKEQIEIILSTANQLSEAGSLKSNNAAIAVLEFPTLEGPKKLNNLALLLENINDPGNLGTVSELQIGMELKIFFVLCKRLMYTIQKRFRLRWVLFCVSEFIMEMNLSF